MEQHLLEMSSGNIYLKFQHLSGLVPAEQLALLFNELTARCIYVFRKRG